LETTDAEGSTDKVFIAVEEAARPVAKGSKNKKAKRKIVYTLHTEYRTALTSERDVSRKKCEIVFTTKQEAIAHSPNLIDNFGLYDGNYGSIDVDFRENPDGAPNNGLILETKDEEGSTERVFLAIEKSCV